MNEYRRDFRQFENEARWTAGRFLFRVCVPVLALVIAFGVVARVFNWFGRAAQVVSQELDPGTLLKRYEWFKSASAQLDKKQADIDVYESRFKNLSADYNGQPRNAWAREDREQFNVWQSEVAGIKASYNGLAAEYNSAMAKINYSFTNVGELPKGSDSPLPREYKPYETK